MASSVSSFRSPALSRSNSSGYQKKLSAQHARKNISHATRNIFHVLDVDGTHTVSSKFFLDFLHRNGLLREDPRLESLFGYLKGEGALENDVKLTPEQFDEAISSCRTLVLKCVAGELRVPSFDGLVTKIFKQIYDEIKSGDNDGDLATYIPQLACVDPELFAMSITTVDGQHYSIGDADVPFCLQSAVKPISYIVALEHFGSDKVHNHVGTEPSGQRFNQMTLKTAPTKELPNRQIPHNPMVNAGAICVASMIYPELSMTRRLNKFLETILKGSGPDVNRRISVDEATFKSEVKTADRNRCLAYMMKEEHAFPEDCFDYDNPNSVNETLELYFKMCSITSTSKLSSVMAATLANGGLNPFTGDRVMSAAHVRDVLPLMFSCGMYDYSGQWAYEIGVPAKSGVSGSVFLVIPNVCGISIFSPRLDAVGNSVRGVLAAKALVNHFAFHNFEVFSGFARRKIDPTLCKNAVHYTEVADLLFAASEGDLASLNLQFCSGADLFVSDYDQRTALHLAASEGHTEIVRFIIECAPGVRRHEMISLVDRFGGTPLDCAAANGEIECYELLRKAGALRGSAYNNHASKSTNRLSVVMQNVTPRRRLVEKIDSDGTPECSPISHEAPQIIFAASTGDLDELAKMSFMGMNFELGDYDQRTALHLAASNNHLHIIKYLKSQIGPYRWEAACKITDGWGNTPYDDAVREGHVEIQQFLRDEDASFSDAQTHLLPNDKHAETENLEKMVCMDNLRLTCPTLGVSLFEEEKKDTTFFDMEKKDTVIFDVEKKDTLSTDSLSPAIERSLSDESFVNIHSQSSSFLNKSVLIAAANHQNGELSDASLFQHDKEVSLKLNDPLPLFTPAMKPDQSPCSTGIGSSASQRRGSRIY